MRRLTTAILLGLSFTLGAAWTAAGDANKDDRAATLELIRTVVPRAAYEAMLAQMYAQMSAGMEQAGGQPLPPNKRKALEAAIQEVLPYEELVSWSADVYTRHFTRKEIDDLAVFYRTPTGQKAARMLPTISGEVGAKIGPLMMTRMPEVLKKHGLM
jgi:uncharacterized protein